MVSEVEVEVEVVVVVVVALVVFVVAVVVAAVVAEFCLFFFFSNNKETGNVSAMGIVRKSILCMSPLVRMSMLITGDRMVLPMPLLAFTIPDINETVLGGILGVMVPIMRP